MELSSNVKFKNSETKTKNQIEKSFPHTQFEVKSDTWRWFCWDVYVGVVT